MQGFLRAMPSSVLKLLRRCSANQNGEIGNTTENQENRKTYFEEQNNPDLRTSQFIHFKKTYINSEGIRMFLGFLYDPEIKQI